MVFTRLVFKLFAPSVGKRILGGFAVVLFLLVTLAVVGFRGMEVVGSSAVRASRDSAQATASAEVALLVGEARALVVQYALTATMDDQKAAQAALIRLDGAIERHVDDGGTRGRDLQALATRYRAAVDASIAAVEARRSDVEQMQAAATELRTIVSAATQVTESATDPVLLAAVARLADSFGAADGAAARFVASRTPAEANAGEGALQALRGNIEVLGRAAAGNRRVERFIKGMTEPLDRFEKELKLVAAGDEKLRLATAARDAAAADVLRVATDQRARAAEAQGEAITAMLAGTSSARWLSLLTSTSALAIGLVLALLIGRSIANPIRKLTIVMHGLADGNLDTEIPYGGRRDELGEMARAVVVFKENAQAVHRLRQAQEEEHERGAAEKRVALQGMADTIETQTQVALEQIGRTTAAMAATADEMAASASRTGAAAQDAATASAHALANAQTVASAAEELAASIREIGSQASQSSVVVDRAVAAGNNARLTIETLNDEVARIGLVADMIGEIAARTNLLALNATIEAARAGDAGKGFAVVASEVKQLASQTARSTEEIGRHIAQVRAATGASVNAVTRIEQTISEMNAIAGSIAASVEEQGAATAEIARNVSETASAATEMTNRTQSVSVEAKDTGCHAVEVRANTATLDIALRELRQTVIRAVRTSTVEVDRRRSRRHQVDMPCRVSCAGEAATAGRILDLSASGARIAGGASLTAGARGTLDIDACKGTLPFRVCNVTDDILCVAFESEAATDALLSPILEALERHEAA